MSAVDCHVVDVQSGVGKKEPERTIKVMGCLNDSQMGCLAMDSRERENDSRKDNIETKDKRWRIFTLHIALGMTTAATNDQRSSQVVLQCRSLNETLSFFTDRLGFRVDIISPADDPSVIVISGYGIHLRLERQDEQTSSTSSVTLRLTVKDESRQLVAPNGTRVLLVRASDELAIPSIASSLIVTRMKLDEHRTAGRAGMFYRDLIPDRQGGRFIASHITIAEGGPISDHVHYHKVRFQMIYVHRGWVRLVYEDQGEPFVLHAGDCVLQPPLIRHRVLESSVGLQVVEIACPAVHDTYIDHDTPLPTGRQLPDRDYHGQRFVKYIAKDDGRSWQPWRLPSLEYRSMGIARATQSLADARILRRSGSHDDRTSQHTAAELVFFFVLSGELSLQLNDESIDALTEGDAFVIPNAMSYAFHRCSHDLQLLEVSLPGDITLHDE